MSKTVQCDIVSAENAIFSGSIESLTATGTLGELGVQYGHAPLLTQLIPGPVRLVMPDGEEELVFVSGGYLEVQPHLVTILADTAIRAHDIDEAAAEQAKSAAKDALVNQSGELDYGKASSELAFAAAQLMTINKLRSKIK